MLHSTHLPTTKSTVCFLLGEPKFRQFCIRFYSTHPSSNQLCKLSRTVSSNRANRTISKRHRTFLQHRIHLHQRRLCTRHPSPRWCTRRYNSRRGNSNTFYLFSVYTWTHRNSFVHLHRNIKCSCNLYRNNRTLHLLQRFRYRKRWYSLESSTTSCLRFYRCIRLSSTSTIAFRVQYPQARP